MLALPQAAQLSIHFLWRKISNVAPPWGTWFWTHYWRIEREEKSPAPGRNRVLLRRYVLYCRATIAAHPLNLVIWNSFLVPETGLALLLTNEWKIKHNGNIYHNWTWQDSNPHSLEAGSDETSLNPFIWKFNSQSTLETSKEKIVFKVL